MEIKTPIVTKKDIIEGLKKLGIEKGDLLFVHSSLSSFGYVENGANTVIDALIEVIGEEGTLAMPSFPAFIGGEYGLVLNNQIVFDVRISPTAMGKIPDTFWRRPGVKRSIHPTHSVAAWGKMRDWLIADHEKCSSSCGANTPFHKICLSKGKILLIGVTHANNTCLHTVEDTNGVPTRSCELFYPKVIDYEGKVVTVPTYPHLPGFKRDYQKMDEICKSYGIQKEIKIGNSLLKIIDAQRMYEIGSTMVRENPLFLIDTKFYENL